MNNGLGHPALREEMVAAVELLFRAGVMPHSGHANFSCRLDDERMLVTSGVIVRDLRPEGLAVVTFDGQVEGESDGCAVDVVDMHATVYRARPAARSVLHTHSPAVTAFAVANRPLPCRYETLYRFGGQVGEVPLARWSPERRDPAFLHSITAAIEGQPGTRAVLLANHGVLAFAPSPTAAAMLVIALEEAAEAELAAAAIGGARDFPQPASS